MAHEDRTPDFEDLLAAFDIPDVPSVPASQRDQDGNCNTHYDNSEAMETSHIKVENSDKSHLDDKKKLLPTSKLILGATGKCSLTPKSPVFTLTLTPVAASKSVPVLTNRQVGQVQVAPSNSIPITSATALVSINNAHLGTSVPPDGASDDTTYQLSTNVLPPYVPLLMPPDKFKLSIPSEGYKCDECGDQFIFESSLVQHLQRRSVYITFNCDSCKKILIYYNRCNLLNHIRCHREKNQSADIKKADISPLPLELMNNIQPRPSSTIQASGSVVMTSSPVTTIIMNGPPRLTKAGVQNADGRFRCSECSQFFESATAIEDHFGRSQNMPLATSQCTKCNMTCPSKCSLSAHQRIHLQSKPFICPECGQKVSDNWAAFQRHLGVKCLHYSRTIGYKCSICTVLYSSAELLRQHIISTHSESYYKCQACPMAFKAGNTFDTHKKTAHLTMDVQCKMIFKCPLCDTVFHSSEQLHSHLDVHIKEQIRATKFVFKCFVCFKLLEAKPVLAEHLKEAHPGIVTKEICVFCGESFDNKDLLAAHKVDVHGALTNTGSTSPVPISSGDIESPKKEKISSHQGLTTCEQCNRVFPTGHGYKIHMQRCHGSNNSSITCFVCNQQFSCRSDIVSHGRKHLNEGLLVCTVCSNHPFDSRSGLIKHLDSHAANMKLPSKCDHCGEIMKDIASAARHLKIEHGFTNFYTCDKCDMNYYSMNSLIRHERIVHNYGGSRRKYICWICQERDFGKRILLEKHIIFTHKIPANEIDYSKMLRTNRPPIKIKIPRPVYMAAVMHDKDGVNAPVNSSKQFSKSDQVVGYMCSKCDFTSNERNIFLEHIVIHKTDRHSLQCRECGSCFVVEPSLRKHLMIAHKVRNVDQYLNEGGLSSEHSSDVDAGTEINGISGLTNSLECTVCYCNFTTEAALKTHMRTHGMAFIRSKRLTTATTSESSPSSS